MGCTWGGVLYGFSRSVNASARYADGIRGSVVSAKTVTGANKPTAGTIAVPALPAASAARGD